MSTSSLDVFVSLLPGLCILVISESVESIGWKTPSWSLEVFSWNALWLEKRRGLCWGLPGCPCPVRRCSVAQEFALPELSCGAAAWCGGAVGFVAPHN